MTQEEGTQRMAAARRHEALALVAPDPARHGEAICDLVSKTFSGDGFFESRNHCRNGYILNSAYDWKASRIGLVGDRLVTHFGVWDITMRIGKARVRMGGIGGVSTDPEYRKRGLMARTARAAIAAMRECGYDVSVLFGIRDFYHRFGYVRAWSQCDYIVPAGELPKERPAARLRTLKPGPRDDLVRLYNRASARFTGTAVKPARTRRLWQPFVQGRFWTDARGRMAGYVVFRPRDGRLECREACGDPEQVLRALATVARQSACGEIRLEAMPYDSPLIRRVRWGNCRAETHHARCGGAMVATINLASTLEKMRGELQDRLRASHFASWRGDLVVADARQAATLGINRSHVRVTPGGRSRHAIRGGDRVAQLLIGTDDPAEIIRAARMRTTGDALAMARVLFPNEHPVMGLLDRF